MPNPKSSHAKRYWAIGAVLVLLLFCTCIFAGAFVLVDPFQWGIVGSVKMVVGLGGNPAAAAMPENTPMYLGINLLNAQPDKLNRVIQPFIDAIGSSSGSTATAMQDVDKQMKETLGVTLTDDVVPWVGKSVGIGFTKAVQSSYRLI